MTAIIKIGRIKKGSPIDKKEYGFRILISTRHLLSLVSWVTCLYRQITTFLRYSISYWSSKSILNSSTVPYENEGCMSLFIPASASAFAIAFTSSYECGWFESNIMPELGLLSTVITLLMLSGANRLTVPYVFDDSNKFTNSLVKPEDPFLYFLPENVTSTGLNHLTRSH